MFFEDILKEWLNWIYLLFLQELLSLTGKILVDDGFIYIQTSHVTLYA